MYQNGNGSVNGHAIGRIKSICVYLASNEGIDPDIRDAVVRFAELLVMNDIRLVCGGGGRGLMKLLVETVLSLGGNVVAVTPEFLLSKEGGILGQFKVVRVTVASPFEDENLVKGAYQIITHDMHERKRIMFVCADAFVALPGGIGTLEELVEQLTWAQLGRHKKPILVANIKGFWEPLIDIIVHMQRLRYITCKEPVKYLVANRADDILAKLMEQSSALNGFDEEQFTMHFLNPETRHAEVRT